MKTQTYKDMIRELVALYNKDQTRFMTFYKRVTNIVASIPEGDTIDLRCYVDNKSIDIATKIAISYISEISQKLSVNDDYYEFIDDYCIKHVARLTPSKPWVHFYSKKQ